MSIALAVILCTVLGALGATILVVAAKFMAVEEDPRIAEVNSVLAGANCGGCGYAGCADYAKAVVMDGVPANLCAPGGTACAQAIAAVMGVETTVKVKKAVIGCQGNTEHCKPMFDYMGMDSCLAASKLYRGPKACNFACLGFGDCTKACKFNAIKVVDHVATVDKDLCTGCGACKSACPQKIIWMHEEPNKPVVLCSNPEPGRVSMKECSTTCIGCGLCQRNCPEEAIKVVNFVARIDYDKCTGCGICATKCPKKIIAFPLREEAAAE